MRLIGTHGAGPHRVVMRLAGHALGMGRGFAAAGRVDLPVAGLAPVWSRRPGRSWERMPEGDTIERIAQRLQPLVGTVPEIATPHPRHAALRIPERLAGQALDGSRRAASTC